MGDCSPEKITSFSNMNLIKKAETNWWIPYPTISNVDKNEQIGQNSIKNGISLQNTEQPRLKLPINKVSQ